jgi:hypothetical protein
MDQNTVEAEGLRRTRLAARLRQALYHVSAADLARAHERMREASLERHLDYFMDGEVNTIRVLPLPITILPEQVEYLYGVVRTLHRALVRMPELYLCDPQVRALLRNRRKTLGSAPAGRPPSRPGTRCSTGWTAWWTTRARSGRKRCGSWSPI